jgi:hypothetical protein
MESIVIAVRTPRPATVPLRPDRGGATGQQVGCNNQPNRSQRTIQDFDTRRSISLYSQALGMRLTSGLANDKRYRRHQPASCPEGQLAGNYPYDSKQSNPAPLRVIRLQLRCNPDSRKSVRTRFFHRFRNLAGPMETPLCKISF